MIERDGHATSTTPASASAPAILLRMRSAGRGPHTLLWTRFQWRAWHSVEQYHACRHPSHLRHARRGAPPHPMTRPKAGYGSPDAFGTIACPVPRYCMGRRQMSMSNVLASEANVDPRHELFSTCCLRKDGKCRDTTRHALKKRL